MSGTTRSTAGGWSFGQVGGRWPCWSRWAAARTTRVTRSSSRVAASCPVSWRWRRWSITQYGWVGEGVVGEGDGPLLSRVVGGVGDVAGEDSLDALLVAGVAEFGPGGIDRGVRRHRVRLGGGPGGDVVEVAAVVARVVGQDRWRGLVGRSRRGCVPRDGRRCGARSRSVSSTCCTGSGCAVGQWASGRLGGDEGVDLFELDDVGPVGDDPVRAGRLGRGWRRAAGRAVRRGRGRRG